MRIICRLLVLAASALVASPSVIAADDRAPVLIYFANETHLNAEASENYRVLGEWLRTDEPTGAGVKIADQLAADLKDFRKAVDNEVEAIVLGASSAKTVNVLVFTNVLSSTGKYLIFKSGSDKAQERGFELPGFDNYVGASHPNGQASVLRAALEIAAREFSPQNYRFSLVTKSHGSAFHILIPRLTVRHESSSRAAFLDIANGRIKIEGMPAWMKGLGTTRQEYFKELGDIGRSRGMEFDLVFTESCKSRVGLDQSTRLPANISTLVSPRVDLDYQTIDYKAAFTTPSPIVAIGKQLLAKFPDDVALATTSRSVFARSFLWWVPLLVLVLVGTGYKAFKREPKSA